MSETKGFAHGTYGDDSGVTFYGPPTAGFWEDRLKVSDRFIEPLFRAVLDHSGRRLRGGNVPTIAIEWNECSGWTAELGIQEFSVTKAKELVSALTDLSVSDLAKQLAKTDSEECLRVASVICRFLQDRIDRGLAVYVQRD